MKKKIVLLLGRIDNDADAAKLERQAEALIRKGYLPLCGLSFLPYGNGETVWGFIHTSVLLRNTIRAVKGL